MSLTINDIPGDCWNEIFSHLPRSSYPAIGCVSKQFPKVIQFFSQKEKKILETFIKFVQNYEPSFNPAPINFSAINLFELNIQIRAYETKIAKTLSNRHLTVVPKHYYHDLSGIFFLATFNQKNITPQDLEILIKYGYLEDAIRLGKSIPLPSVELVALARKSGGQLMALIDPSFSIPVHYLNQIKNAIAISMLRGDKIEEFLTRFQYEPLDEATQTELTFAYAKRGDFEGSLATYDSLKVEPYKKMNLLTTIGISCAQAGCLAVLHEVDKRGIEAWKKTKSGIENKIPTVSWLDDKPGRWPSGYTMKEIYKAIDFEKVTTKELCLFLEHAYFDPFVFEAITKLYDDEMIERYFNECSAEEKSIAFSVLLNSGKIQLAKKLSKTVLSEKLIVIAEYLCGIRSELDLFEAELLKEQSDDLIGMLAVLYTLKGERQKSDSLLEKIKIEENRVDIILKIIPILIEQHEIETAFEKVKGNNFLLIRLFQAYARHEHFDPLIMINCSDLKEKAKKKLCLDFLTSLLLDGKVEKTIPIYHYLKGHTPPNVFYKLGLEYAKNGFINLAIEIALAIEIKYLIGNINPAEYYNLLQEIRLNKTQ